MGADMLLSWTSCFTQLSVRALSWITHAEVRNMIQMFHDDRTTSGISQWPLTYPSSPKPKACWLLVISIEKNWNHYQLHLGSSGSSKKSELATFSSLGQTLKCTHATLRWLLATPPSLSGAHMQVYDWVELHCSDWPAHTNSKAHQEETLMTVHFTSHLAVRLGLFMCRSNVWTF